MQQMFGSAVGRQAAAAAGCVPSVLVEVGPDELAAVVAHGLINTLTFTGAAAAAARTRWPELERHRRVEVADALVHQMLHAKEAVSDLPPEMMARVEHVYLASSSAQTLASSAADLPDEECDTLLALIRVNAEYACEPLRELVGDLPLAVQDLLDALCARSNPGDEADARFALPVEDEAPEPAVRLDDRRRAANRLGQLEIDVSREDGQVIFALRGDVDVFTAADLRENLAFLSARSVEDVVLDMSKVEFIDGAGLGFVVGAHRRLTGAGRRFVLRRPSPAVRATMEFTGTDTYFEVE